MIKAKLIVVGGDAKAKEVDLRLPTVIGRSRDVTLTLPHPLVSRRHTELFEESGHLYVRDLGSLNGTYVNNRRIDSPQRLEPNELLTLGNVTFRAVYEADIEDTLATGNVTAGGREGMDEKDETVSLGRTEPAQPSVSPKDRCNQSDRRQSLKNIPAVSVDGVSGSTNPLADQSSEEGVSDPGIVGTGPLSMERVDAGHDSVIGDFLSGEQDFIEPERYLCLVQPTLCSWCLESYHHPGVFISIWNL